MALVATINGVEVYSDKNVSGIVNSKINFSDGSWIDVNTNEVVNKGNGYIKIGNEPDSNAQETGSIKKSHSANKLEIRKMGAKLNIQPHNSDKIEIEISGPKNMVSKNLIKKIGDTVVIETDESGNSQSINTGGSINVGGINISQSIGGIKQNLNFSGGSNIHITQSNVGRNIQVTNINSKSSNTKVKINVKVPKGAYIEANSLTNETIIGDTEGPVNLTLISEAYVKTGKVTDATLTIKGNGEMRIQEVNGNLSMNITGNGEIKVIKGEASNVNVNVTGNADIIFGGNAKNANINATGNGDIELNYVENRPFINKAGNADIDIGNW